METRDDYIRFLQRQLPPMGYRWAGFRKVKNQVIRRIAGRMGELGLAGLKEYEALLSVERTERELFDGMLRITISRFYRDRGVCDMLRADVLPRLAREAASRGAEAVHCLSAGCCSGEEPYTLKIIWDLELMPAMKRKLPLRITAMDSGAEMLERARAAAYTESSVSGLPPELREKAFVKKGGMYLMKDELKEGVEFIRHDVRQGFAGGPFDIILCRNLVLTYFGRELQEEVMGRLTGMLRPGGMLVIGIHEKLPWGVRGMALYESSKCIYQKQEQTT